MISLEDFWRMDEIIVAKFGARFGKKLYNCVDYCGIEPVRHPDEGYFCTPKNSRTFARTGGDGVHFGIITNDVGQGANKPIVMTVPMATRNNVVIAESLDEFFGIGCHVGWAALEQLVYDFEGTITYYSNQDDSLTKQQKTFLEIVREELKANHVPLTKDRLEELDDKYYKMLNIDSIE
ncbi:hypothetical protein [Chryseolinea sp. H1M3-3]|uniref:hypothetical protein n=1 Tax=Chryseolinea sp. H1M3-3 TaxID=3034144 RepID=UPI0023EDD8B6|nr:hypothetical protein [Chryseolinea sp. H1M3-3]